MLPLLIIALSLLVSANVAHDILGFSTAVEVFTLPFTPVQRRFSLEIEEEGRLGDIVFRVIPSPESRVSSFSRLDIAPNCSGADYFTVSNVSSGDVRLFRLLDYEFTQTVDIDVRAWLAPPGPGSIASAAHVAPMAHALINVHVININDHEPIFDAPKDPQTGELYAQISENAPPGTRVAQLHATDEDPGEVGEVRYVVVGVAPGTPIGFADAFGVDPVEGSVRVVNSTLLDREMFREIDLLVAAVDNPNHPTRQYATISRLTIALIDQNDNPPKFGAASSMAPASVCECAKPGTFVGQVTAEDLDESSQNQLSYRIVDANVTFAPYVPDYLLRTDPRNLFSIDQSTGRVTVTALSLASLIGSYSLLIEVADQGGLTARTVLFFNVSSDNKFAPEFTVPISAWTDGASIAENLPQDTRVFQVTAIDRDTFGSNNQIEYFFYEASTNSLVSQSMSGFRIHKTTGIIYSARLFNAETDPPVVELTVVARDRGTPALQTNATLLIRILDQDEFPPRWAVIPTDGCNMQFNFYIPERSPIGGRVGRVWSIDSDRTNRSYFRLEARNDAKYFAVNPTTGVITITNPDPANAGTTTPGQEVTATFLDFEDKEHRDFVLFVSVSPLSSGNDFGVSSTTPLPGGQPGVQTGCLRGNVARVYIHLTNMEDDRPVFSRGNKPYYYCISGDAVKNTLVSYLPPIIATDADGSKLTFRLSSNEWRSSAGFVSVTCALRLQQAPFLQTADLPTGQLLVNSAIGNYSRSYFRVPIDVRDDSGQSASTVAYVWVTPPETDSTAHDATGLSVSSVDSTTVIQPSPPPDKSTYYATLTVAQKYDVFISKISEWIDCVSERLLAGDRVLAGAPLCIASVIPHPNDPNGLTEVRIGAASKQDMLLMPAVLLASVLQKQINETGGGLCGVIGATCLGCVAPVVEPLITGALVAEGIAGGFDPLALLIALACILLFLILLLLILLAICCRARKKAPILIPAPPPPPVVPVFAVKPARLYETQEAYMSVDHDQAKERGFEEQEVVLDEGEEGETEEVFEIPLPREYETQTVLLDMPTWAARDYGHDNPTLILDHGVGEPQQIPLTQQNGARHLSGSVYSEPYFKSTHVEQRAFSMLHIDTRPQPACPVPAVARTANQAPVSQPPRRHVPSAATAELSPTASSSQLGGNRPIMHLIPAPAISPPGNSSIQIRSPRSPHPVTPNFPGTTHIARRLGDLSPPPGHRQSPPRTGLGPGGLLRPAISADSITLLSQQQQARRAALQHHQDHHGEMRGGNGARTDESEPSEAEDAMRRHQHGDDDEMRTGNGRLRRTRSLPKYLQPPAELQSVMAELHDYIKSPEQKARRRRISQKYRAKLLASGGGAALSNQTGQTSSSSNSLDQDSQATSQQQSISGRSGNQGQGRDYMML